jgi:hypothetical protein
MNYTKHFNQYCPQPTDFPAAEYESHKQEIDQAASEAGYRYVGERLGRAVFSSKL